MWHISNLPWTSNSRCNTSDSSFWIFTTPKLKACQWWLEGIFKIRCTWGCGTIIIFCKYTCTKRPKSGLLHRQNISTVEQNGCNLSMLPRSLPSGQSLLVPFLYFHPSFIYVLLFSLLNQVYRYRFPFRCSLLSNLDLSSSQPQTKTVAKKSVSKTLLSWIPIKATSYITCQICHRWWK